MSVFTSSLASPEILCDVLVLLQYCDPTELPKDKNTVNLMLLANVENYLLRDYQLTLNIVIIIFTAVLLLWLLFGLYLSSSLHKWLFSYLKLLLQEQCQSLLSHNRSRLSHKLRCHYIAVY